MGVCARVCGAALVRCLRVRVLVAVVQGVRNVARRGAGVGGENVAVDDGYVELVGGVVRFRASLTHAAALVGVEGGVEDGQGAVVRPWE